MPWGPIDLPAPLCGDNGTVQDLGGLGFINSSNCTYPWTQKYLGECACDKMQLAGLIIGLSSILCWMVAQTPQLYKNWRAGTAEGLSGIFLADWLAGDITNLVGCILTKQVPTQLYTAIWFCIIDTSMLAQWIYYVKILKRTHVSAPKDPKTTVMACAFVVLLAVPFVASFTGGPASLDTTYTQQQADYVSSDFHSRVLASASKKPHVPAFDTPTSIAGWVIGWVSGLMYFTSRIPQIVKNFKDKSVEGLSFAMFVMAILGNIAYACGVLMVSVEAGFVIDHLPWLLGSVGTLVFDFTIFVQFCLFGDQPRPVSKEAMDPGEVLVVDETDPLLGVQSQ
eukprot:m.356028 g.356028  ORF g.356028 m.356028 type:complete len:338 (+) comp17424_c0_seq1:434-1447(+)